MLKWALRSFLLAIVCSVIGWLALGHVVFEVFRVGAGALFTVGFLLLFVWYIRTPQPPEA